MASATPRPLSTSMTEAATTVTTNASANSPARHPAVRCHTRAMSHPTTAPSAYGPRATDVIATAGVTRVIGTPHAFWIISRRRVYVPETSTLLDQTPWTLGPSRPRRATGPCSAWACGEGRGPQAAEEALSTWSTSAERYSHTTGAAAR